MKKMYFFLLGALSLMKVPQQNINNGILRAKVYLPDPEKGYYRGTRFDHSGNIVSLKWKGHSFFGKWFEGYDPKTHDAIMGPVEEFTSPDYDERKPGESFLKIGVGELTKPDNAAYAFARLYPVVNHGKWTVIKKTDSIGFIHDLDGKEYSYNYEKTISLTKDKPEMVISHVIRNTGNKTIETSVYDHNFFMIDTRQIGPGIDISFPFNLKGDGQGVGELAELEGNKIVFLRNINAPETVFISGLSGFSEKTSDYDIRIENHESGAGVRISCDQPFLKINFWSCATTACPEPYIMIKAEPGKDFRWTIKYEFYDCR